MNCRGLRFVTLFAAAAVIALAGAACGSSQQPTPIYVVQTPTPTVGATGATATPEATPTPEIAASATYTPLPTPTPSVSPTFTPQVSPTPTSSASPTPKASPSPTASPTATVSAGPTSRAQLCTGKPDNLVFLANAASTLPFDVYCGRISAPWYLSGGSYAGATLTINYKGPSGAAIEVHEGAFCRTSAAVCSPHLAVLGTGSFGGLSGNLDSLSGGGFAIYVNPGTAVGYTITGTGMTQATFVHIAAAFRKVPKS